MRSIALALTLLAAGTALAQEAPRLAPFPDDYRPSPCAPDKTCESFERSRMTSAARSFLGLSLDFDWVEAHWDEMMASFKPVCAKAGTCYAIHGSTFQWCNDLVMPEFRAVCNRYQKGSADWTQCTMFVETWALGRDQRSMQPWKDAQACATAKEPFQPKSVTPIVWMVPAKVTHGYNDFIRVYAVDPDTHRPIPGRIFIDKQTVYASANPTGWLWTYYPWKWPVKFNRVPNADGHRDLEAPMMTFRPEGFPEVSWRMPIDVPKLTVSMSPTADKLKRGRNTVTVTARDAATGEPVELRIMYGDDIAGESNKPFTLDIARKGKRRELWGTSLFERYSDVVIAPAQK